MINKGIKIIKDDITKLQVDAIVNAANNELRGGSGVDGAIHLAGGPEIMEECRLIGNCKTVEAVITTAGLLNAKYVIHTVGPIWQGGYKKEEELLKKCYISSLKLALKYKVKIIAFPNISTGVYMFPKKKAVNIAINTVIDFIDHTNEDIEVIFCCYSFENYDLYLKNTKNR